MAAQGATLQNYNNELVKCVDDLKEKREEVNKAILKDVRLRAAQRLELSLSLSQEAFFGHAQGTRAAGGLGPIGSKGRGGRAGLELVDEPFVQRLQSSGTRRCCPAPLARLT